MTRDAVFRLSEIADRPAPVGDRAQSLLSELGRHVPFDASWVALAEPDDVGYAPLASTALDEGTLEYLRGPSMARDIELSGADHARPPLSLSDLPYASAELETWGECLLPSGFHEGLGVALFGRGGRHVGFLALLFGDAEPPPAAIRRRLARLLPTFVRGVDPVRSMVTATLLHDADAGVVLLPADGVDLLPGLPGDELLAAGSTLVEAARAAISDGRLYASFLWPRGNAHAPHDHVRVTVLSSVEGFRSVLIGAVVLSPAPFLHGLTPRELEVLGLVIEGRSNHEIAHELVVAPRTVAAHMEHILVKLRAGSRTLAAVRAERAGLYVPASPTRREDTDTQRGW